MNEINASQLLVQMRAMAAAAQAQAAEPSATNAIGSDFSNLLTKSINSVNDLQMESKKLGDAFVTGDPGVSLAEVMVAKQKASIAFEATIQVRNRLLSAYKEIMAMQV